MLEPIICIYISYMLEPILGLTAAQDNSRFHCQLNSYQTLFETLHLGLSDQSTINNIQK